MALQLDVSQQAVLGLPDDLTRPEASAVVVGAPGSGKTETLIAFAADRVRRGVLAADEVLVLAGSRRTAALLRDRLARELGAVTTGPLARTASSVGWELAAARGRALGQPPLRLLSGAEQDAIIRELLDGHARDGRGPGWPEALGPAVRRLPVFRTELRELLMRATEYGLGAAGLHELGRREGRPEWVAAADFALEYLQVVASSHSSALDPAELGTAAVAAIRGGQLGERLAAVRLILVDELQEATEAAVRMVAAFAARGVAVIGFGDPDIAVNGFRGAAVDAVRTLPARIGRTGAPQFLLHRVHRHGTAIREVICDATGRIGAAGEGAQRAAEADGEAWLAAISAASPAQLNAAIAHRLRERRLHGAVPWGELAVIVRTSRAIPGVARALAAAGIPVASAPAGAALRDSPAAAALLQLVSIAIGREPLTGERAADLLLGPYGGLDPVGLRRLRNALRAEELAGGGRRGSSELLVEALEAPGRLVTIDHPVGRRATRMAELLAAVRGKAETGATAEELLWTAWSEAQTAPAWEAQALGSGAAAAEANRALDSVVAVFAAARRFAELSPERPARDFLADVLDAEIADDVLAPARAADAVLVATASGSTGREFDTVVVAELQDGVWPNLRLRGSLLGPQKLVDHLTGRAGPTDFAAERAAVLGDELRIFALAASRARSGLVVAALDNDDDRPSPLFHMVAGRAGGARADESAWPLELRPLVAALRRSLTDPKENPLAAEQAAAGLALLAAAGVEGAAPEQWNGLAGPSTSAPLADPADPEDRIDVSPSRIDTIERSPMEAFVERYGGSSRGVPQGLGSLVHWVLENYPAETDRNLLWKAFQARWPELSFDAAWDEDRELFVAREAITGLADYLARVAREKGEHLASEEQFRLELPHAVLTGRLDRVEKYPDGLVIMDLKTGRPIPERDAENHPQLGAYQLAHAEGALTHRGPLRRARLVYTSSPRKSETFTVLDQEVFDDERLAEFRERVSRAALQMIGPRFSAKRIRDRYKPGRELRAVHLPGEPTDDGTEDEADDA